VSFTSYTYLAFLIVAVVIARWTEGRARETVLLLASLVFYAAWDVRFVAVLLAVGVFTYFAGHAVAQKEGAARADATAGKRRLAWLGGSIAAVLGVLAVFKYGAMLVELANLAPFVRLPVPSLVLPLGISFFTFECVSYLLDVYKGGKELRPLRRFLLFPALWPHMVAGPILRIKELAPQLEAPVPARAAEILAGVDRVLIGWAKKLVLANALAPLVDQGFANGAAANSAIDDWVLALAFGLQIYFDFSAYTDIAIGSARMLGFTFPENFSLPYHAASPTDFWNRWHMTLSRWIRDYLFFPLNLKAGKRLWLRYVYLVLVMALVGLWHGAGLGFVLWGVWHGALMVGHRLLEGPAKRLPVWMAKASAVAGRLATLALVNAGWILFRSPTVGQAGRMLRAMFTLRGLKPAFSVNDYLVVLLAIGCYAGIEPFVKRFVDRDPLKVDYARWRFWLRPFAYGLALELTFMFDRSNVAFIYFQF
jgi:alginate O-acetyltransferase complex protein AlgI